MYVPKTANLLISPKVNEPPKHYKMAVATPKNKVPKKSVK